MLLRRGRRGIFCSSIDVFSFHSMGKAGRLSRAMVSFCFQFSIILTLYILSIAYPAFFAMFAEGKKFSTFSRLYNR